MLATPDGTVVHLHTYDAEGDALGFGRGFFVTANQIVTARHVVVGAARVVVSIEGESYGELRSVVADDEAADLLRASVRRLGGRPGGLRPQPMRLTEGEVELGQAVWLALGGDGSRLGGEVLGIAEQPDGERRIRISTPIQPGHSGGPIVDASGAVVGLVSAVSIIGDDRRSLIVPARRISELRAGKAVPLRRWKAEWERSPEATFVEGLRELGRQDYDAAVAQFDDVVARDPSYRKAWIHTGAVRLEMGDVAGASRAFGRFLRSAPDDAEAHKLVGLVTEMQGDRSGALAHYRRAVELAPRYADAHKLIGLLELERGRYQSAIDILEHALALSPDDLRSVECGLYIAHENLGHGALANHYMSRCHRR